MSRYVDLHIHGALGVDVVTAGPDELDRLAAGLAERGYDGFLPTFVPLRLDDLEAALGRLGPWMAERAPGDGRGALPLGIHFEGPFVSPARAGALHAAAFLDGRREADVERFLALVAGTSGRPMITMAPEIPGGIDLAGEFARRGAVVAVGHTDASFEVLELAAAAGARHMTHFCNAMRPLHHREPGPLTFGLMHDEITIDVIADLHHVDRRVLGLIARVKPAESLALISDAIPPAGRGDGDYPVWNETLTVRDGTARNAAGNLAGSIALLDECVERLASIGVARDRAIRAASTVPRRILAVEPALPR